MPNMYEDVWVLPFKSREFMLGPELQQTVAELRLRMDHEREDGTYEWSAVVFRGVHAYNITSHESCSRDQVKAYDRLVRVHSSEWLGNFSTAESKLVHFRIYFDEFGCYDIGATGVKLRDKD